jgi:hypothetical protein
VTDAAPANTVPFLRSRGERSGSAANDSTVCAMTTSPRTMQPIPPSCAPSPPVMSRRLLVGAWLVLLTCAGVAQAQRLLGAGSLRAGGGGAGPSTHAWLVAGDARTGATVFHIPPRTRAGGSSGGLRPSEDLLTMPRCIAGVGAKLYLAFDTPVLGPAFDQVEPEPRTVLVVQAVPLGGGRWGNAQVGRLEAAPSLSGRGRLVGLAGTGTSLLAGRLEGNTLVIERLEDDTWRPVHTETVQGEVELFGEGEGFGVVVRDGPRTRIGYRVLSAKEDAQDRPLKWSEAPGDGTWHALACTGQIVLWRVRAKDGSIEVFSQGVPREAWVEWRLLCTLAPCPGETVGVALDDEAKVVFACRGEDEKGAPGSLRLREVSVSSGRMLSDAPASIESPVRLRDVLVLMAMLGVLIGSIVVFVWAPSEEAIAFPEHAAMAEPARRLVATAVDLGLGVGATILAMDLDVNHVFNLAWWGSGDGYAAAIATLAGLVVVCSLLEWLTGRTPGKWLTGCAVVSVKPRNGSSGWRKPTLGQALIRNVIKWGLPPVGLMAMLEADGRARADQHARTAVVVRVEEEAGESGG